MEENFFCSLGISETPFGIESPRNGGWFGPELDGEKLWRRQVFGVRMREKTRWGKAVAAPGVRGQDAREKLKKTVFVL